MRASAFDTSFYLPNGQEPFYHQVKPLMVLMFSVLTFGLYSYWWNYRNWRCIQKNSAEAISPFFRSVFHPFYAVSLYCIINETSSSVGVRGRLFGVMGVLRLLSIFFSFNIPSWSGQPYVDYFNLFFVFVVWLSVDIVYVQFYVEKLNKKLVNAAV